MDEDRRRGEAAGRLDEGEEFNRLSERRMEEEEDLRFGPREERVSVMRSDMLVDGGARWGWRGRREEGR